MSTLFNPREVLKAPIENYISFDSKNDHYTVTPAVGDKQKIEAANAGFEFLVLDVLYQIKFFSGGKYPNGKAYNSRFRRNFNGDFNPSVKIYQSGTLVFEAANESDLKEELEKRFGADPFNSYGKVSKGTRIIGIELDEKGQLTDSVLSFDHKGVVTFALIQYQKENKMDFRSHPVLKMTGSRILETSSGKHHVPVFEQKELEFELEAVKRSATVFEVQQYISNYLNDDSIEFADDMPF